MNKLLPGSIDNISYERRIDKMVENIEKFTWAAEEFGLYKYEIFHPLDLIEKKNLENVLKTLGVLAGRYNKLLDKSSETFKRDSLELAPQIKEYKLGQILGKGQYGTVFKALNMKTGETVAIKRMKTSNSTSKDLDSIMNEVVILKKLSHPNIVKYYHAFSLKTDFFIVLEIIENGSLKKIMKAFGNLPENLTLKYSEQILQGLSYLHSKNLIHCDLKAANILLTKRGTVKLSDFGVSRLLNQSSEIDGPVVGTPYWMAPELVQMTTNVTCACDIWSFGCTVIEMLTGNPPNSKKNPMSAMYSIVNDPIEMPTGISKQLEMMLKSCLEKNPRLRPTALQLLQTRFIFSTHSVISTSEPCNSQPYYLKSPKKDKPQNQRRQQSLYVDRPGQSELARSKDDMCLETRKKRKSETKCIIS